MDGTCTGNIFFIVFLSHNQNHGDYLCINYPHYLTTWLVVTKCITYFSQTELSLIEQLLWCSVCHTANQKLNETSENMLVYLPQQNGFGPAFLLTLLEPGNGHSST
jgi:hypothetical protein